MKNTTFRRISWIGIVCCVLLILTTAVLAQGMTGTVESPKGEPVNDVTLYWIEHGPDGKPHIKSTVQSDSKGSFQFADSVSDLMLNSRYVTLLAESQVYGISFQELRYARDSNRAIRIEFTPVSDVSVSFRDEKGAPVVGIPVRIKLVVRASHEVLSIPIDMKWRWLQKTGSKGECVFSGVPQETSVQWEVDDDRFAHLNYEDRLNLGTGQTQKKEPIILHPGATISGKVLRDGRPVEGVKVGAQGTSNQGYGDGRTDDNGVYRISGLVAGSYNVALNNGSEFEQDWTALARERVKVNTGRKSEGVDLSLIKGVVVTGKVTEKGTGSPIARVYVGIYGPAHPRSGAWVQSTLTNEKGVYKLRVPPGMQYLYIMGSPSIKYKSPEKGVDITLADGESQTSNFELTPTGKDKLRPITGRVVDSDGKLVPFATVSYSSTAKVDDRGELLVKADENGVFTIIPTDFSVKLRARANNLATDIATETIEGQKVTLTVSANMLGSINCQVVDSTGKPIPNAKVSLVTWWTDLGSGSQNMDANEQGKYSFTNLWPDVPYSIRVIAEGFGQAYTKHIHLVPGEKFTAEPIVLRAVSSFVGGVVVDENGDTLENITVAISGLENTFQDTITDDKGRFRFDKLVTEKVDISLRDDGRIIGIHKSVLVGSDNVILVRKQASLMPTLKIVPKRDPKDTSILLRQAPPFQVVRWLNTKEQMPAYLKGKIVLVDFWAIWCSPCRDDLPKVQKAHEQLFGKGVVVVGLHTANEGKDVLEDFIRKNHLTYPIAIDSTDTDPGGFGVTMKSYGVNGIPTAAVIDRTGKLIFMGELESSLKVIDGILKGKVKVPISPKK